MVHSDKQHLISWFGYVEGAVAVLLGIVIAVALTRGLAVFFDPHIYDYEEEQRFLEWLKQDDPNMAAWELREARESYQDDHFWRYAADRLLAYVWFGVGIAVSATATVQLFKKYRSLRFRERLANKLKRHKTGGRNS